MLKTYAILLIATIFL